MRSHDLNRLLNKPGLGFTANSFLKPCPKVGGVPDSLIGRCRHRRSVFPVAVAYTAVSVIHGELRRLTARAGIRRRMTCIGVPQHGQRNTGRGLSGSGGRGAILRTRCSKAIRLFRLGCRKPSLRARRKASRSAPYLRCDGSSTPGCECSSLPATENLSGVALARPTAGRIALKFSFFEYRFRG